MDFKLTARDSEPHHDDNGPLAPDHFSRAGDALAKLVHEAARAAADRRPGMAGPDFSAEPRIAAPVIDVAPRPYDDQATAGSGEFKSDDRRAGRALLRFVAAVCIGVAATLAWQSYGEAAREMIATHLPGLGGSSSPDTTQPVTPQSSAAANERPERAAAQASAAAPSQGAVLAPASPEPEQEFKAMARELAALRQSVQQLTAGQDQMSRTIAKLQASEDDLRAKLATPAPPPTRKPAAKPPQPAPQAVAPGPRPLSQSFVPSPGPPPPQPRPPAGMP